MTSKHRMVVRRPHDFEILNLNELLESYDNFYRQGECEQTLDQRRAFGQNYLRVQIEKLKWLHKDQVWLTIVVGIMCECVS